MDKITKRATILLVASLLINGFVTSVACIPLAFAVYNLVRVLTGENNRNTKVPTIEISIIVLLVLCIIFAIVTVLTATPFKEFFGFSLINCDTCQLL